MGHSRKECLIKNGNFRYAFSRGRTLLELARTFIHRPLIVRIMSNISLLECFKKKLKSNQKRKRRFTSKMKFSSLYWLSLCPMIMQDEPFKRTRRNIFTRRSLWRINIRNIIRIVRIFRNVIPLLFPIFGSIG